MVSDLKKPVTESVSVIKKKLDKLIAARISDDGFPVSLQAVIEKEAESLAHGYAVTCLGLEKSFGGWQFISGWKLFPEQKSFRDIVTNRINTEITKLLSDLKVPTSPPEMKKLQREFNSAYKEAYKARLAEALQYLAEEEAQKAVNKALVELRVQLAEEQG
jgi:allophanate hydrolase subunit 1